MRRDKGVNLKGENWIPHLHVKLIFYLGLAVMVLLTVALIYLYSINVLPIQVADVYSSITLSLIFPTAVFAWLTHKGKDIKSIVSDLGLSRDKLNGRTIRTGIMLFFIIFLLEIFLSLLSQYAHVQVPSTNVDQLLAGTPLFFLLFGIFLSPINEEIFFRGFLVPRFGVVIPAIFFSVFHLGYGSITEFAGALVFGLLAGYYFKKTGSLYVTIIPHLLVNLVTIGSIIIGGGG